MTTKPEFSKSSSSGRDTDRVEIGDLPRGAATRDSKHPGAGHLSFPALEWTTLLDAARGRKL
ncbi:DUF397 domain-containing protein [Nocardiopsis akebiae]|uniref:DUF397 domain-containing protein n=1 Tax=Nocardiopsis akebiae TaxID=2831968 RepID=A0ABX8C4S7_9ACTN|nr:DUF397 domain-containing protein [Nocardiopsis akebiae]QUX28469.1 DUF397 domain-containing protein [Nocardiopsis akebiae]